MQIGDILHFWPEDETLVVTMVNSNGVRLFNLDAMDITDEGSIETQFYTYRELDEVCGFLVNIKTLADIAKKRKQDMMESISDDE